MPRSQCPRFAERSGLQPLALAPMRVVSKRIETRSGLHPPRTPTAMQLRDTIA